MGGFEHASRLGLALRRLRALADRPDRRRSPGPAALREHGITPERVGEQAVRLAGGGLFGDLDAEALAAVGINVGAVRDRMTETFSPAALPRNGEPPQR